MHYILFFIALFLGEKNIKFLDFDVIKNNSSPENVEKLREKLQKEVDSYMKNHPEYEIVITSNDKLEENIEDKVDKNGTKLNQENNDNISTVILLEENENKEDITTSKKEQKEITDKNAVNKEEQEKKINDNEEEKEKSQEDNTKKNQSDNHNKEEIIEISKIKETEVNTNEIIPVNDEILKKEIEENEKQNTIDIINVAENEEINQISKVNEENQEKTLQENFNKIEKENNENKIVLNNSETENKEDIITSKIEQKEITDNQKKNNDDFENKHPEELEKEDSKNRDTQQEAAIIQIIDDENSFFNDKNAMNETPIVEIMTDNKSADETPANQSGKKIEFATIITDEEIEKEEEIKNKTSFLDRIKSTLIRGSDKQFVTEEYNNEPRTIFSRLKEQIMPKKQVTMLEDLKPVARKRKKNDTVIEKEESTGIIDEIANRIKKIEIGNRINNIKDIFTEKFNEIIEKDKNGKIGITLTPQEKIRLEQKKIREIILENEIEQALSNKNEIINYNDNIVDETAKYVEDNEDYQNFLNEKELKKIVEKEKFTIPNVVPKKKNFISYEVNKHPDELIEQRSKQNKHIPPLAMTQEREKLIIKLIEYGLTKDFATIVNNLGDSNYILTSQYTLLTYATKNKQYDIMKYLIQSGANINKRDNRYETPIMLATKNNDIEGVRILINAGVDLNQIDLLKRTPLIYAIEKNFEKIALLLIANGADVNISNSVGEGTLSITTRLNRNNIKQKIIDAIEKKKNSLYFN